MTLFVDTSVWSLVWRRDDSSGAPEAIALRGALDAGELVVTTGLVLQELLQGFHGARAGEAIVERFAALPMLHPDRDDHVEAAAVRSVCRRKGVQLGTIDALLAQLCIRHGLAMLTTDRDFAAAARHVPLKLWRTGH